MTAVAVRILHIEPGPDAGPLARALANARLAMAERHLAGFIAAGAEDVAVVTGRPDDTPFGARLRELLASAPALARGGLIVLGSGSIPLASPADRRAFVIAAGASEPRALANNRYSADVVAVAGASVLESVPDLESDNALPRWLEEVAGVSVDDLRARWRLAVDLDSPLDVELTAPGTCPEAGAVAARLDRVAAVGRDPRAALTIAGRTSAATLSWLERNSASRTRVFVEERGLRTAPRGQRGPRSLLGMLLDRRGPGSLGSILAELGDAALVDSRVLLAHRLGANERQWPSAEDRFAADLLLPERIRDPWLRELTVAAADAPIPVVLGGHALVGPGVRLVVGRAVR